MSRLPGVGPVALGLLVVGGGNTLATALAARTLSPSDFALLVTWSTTANLLGLAFASTETYLPRLVLSPTADDAALVRTFSRGTVVCLLILAGILVTGGPFISPRLFAGAPLLLALVGVYAGALALQSLQRGLAVGRQRFDAFAWQLGADGAVRALGALLLAASGVGEPVVWAAALAAAPCAGLLAARRSSGPWFVLRPAGARVDLAPLGLLVIASLGPLLINNASVPWLAASGMSDAHEVGAVAGAIMLSRIPTLLVGAVYGPVLAPLARAVEANDVSTYARTHRRVLSASVGLAVVFTAGAFLLGPLGLHLYLGQEFRLSRWVLTALGASSGLVFLCTVEQAAVVALGRFVAVPVAWLSGLAAFAGCAFLSLAPVDRVAAAVLLAPLVAFVLLAVQALLAARGLRGGATPGPSRVVGLRADGRRPR